MFASTHAVPLGHGAAFGDLLQDLRRRVGSTPRALYILVGCSDRQMGRLKQDKPLPYPAVILAHFVPASESQNEPAFAARSWVLPAAAYRVDTPAPGLAPVKGLHYFDEGDADDFFGREALTWDLPMRVIQIPGGRPKASRSLTVVGASDSGKSSILRSGLLPELRWQPASAARSIVALDAASTRQQSVHGNAVREVARPFTSEQPAHKQYAFVRTQK